MPSVNTNENDPMNWEWTMPRPKPKPVLFTKPMSNVNCEARAQYYLKKGLVVPPLFNKCKNTVKTKRQRSVINRVNRAQDPFAILGLPKNSSRSMIRKAYLKLSKQHHPNKGGNVNTFRKIKNAYNSLL